MIQKGLICHETNQPTNQPTSVEVWSAVFNLPSFWIASKLPFFSSDCSFRLPEDSARSFSLTVAPRTFSLPKSQHVYIPFIVFSTQPHCGKSIFNSFVNIFLTKTCFSVHITYSCVNFTWFALVSQQNFNSRPVFKPGELCLICYHFE